MTEVAIPFVNSLVVLDADGDRLLAKYYDGRLKPEQLSYEISLHKKSKAVAAKCDVEVILADNELVVFKSGVDCKFFISGSLDENDMVLVAVLDVIYDTVSSLLKGMVEKRAMLDNLELVLLTIDEVLDHGHIMELDSSSVVSRVLMKSSDTTTQQPTVVGDLSISQALGLAREQLFRSLSSGRSDGY